MAQTSYCVELPSTSGHRMVQQVGTVRFGSADKSANITVGFHKLVAGNLNLIGGRNSKTAKIGVLPYIATQQITQCLDRIVVIHRLTAGAFKAGTIMYSLYGY